MRTRSLLHAALGGVAALVALGLAAALVFLVQALVLVVVDADLYTGVGDRLGFVALTVGFGTLGASLVGGLPAMSLGAVAGAIIGDRELRRRTAITVVVASALLIAWLVLVVLNGFAVLGNRADVAAVGAGTVAVAGLAGAGCGALAGVAFLRLFGWMRSVRRPADAG